MTHRLYMSCVCHSFIDRKQEEWTDIKRHLAATSLQTFLTMLLHHNFAHGDLHPGNVLVTSVNEKDGPRLVFLDAGICSTLTPTSRSAFLKIFLQAVKGDGRAVSQPFSQPLIDAHTVQGSPCPL